MKRESVLAMASTASGGVGLLAIAWLATRYLSPAELGFFFSFLSLGALIPMADFGLSYASLQTAGRLAGTGRLAELPAVAVRVVRWNILAASTATAAVGAIGWAIFTSRGAESGDIRPWVGPWIANLLCTLAMQLVLPGISLREGSGKIAQMWTLRLVQECVGGVSCILMLLAGQGLWSVAALAGARALVAWGWFRFGDPFRVGKDVSTYPLGRWMTEVWPFQWRIGVSGLSGFLLFRAFSPIILLEKGPVAAGQFGLAIALMNLLIAVTSAWPMSHAARYARVMANGRAGELRSEFRTLSRTSTALAVLAAAIAGLALWWARQRGVRFATRFPPPVVTSLLLAAGVAHHVVLCFAMFLRAEGRDPLLVPSIAGSVFTVSAVWVAAHSGTLRDVASTYLACTLIGIPIVLLIFREQCQRLLLGAEGASK